MRAISCCRKARRCAPTRPTRRSSSGQRAQLEARNLERKQEAEKIADKLDGQSFMVVRSAGETGQLYGSVSSRDIAELLTAEGFSVGRNQVELNQPIKTIGLTNVRDRAPSGGRGGGQRSTSRVRRKRPSGRPRARP